MSTCPSQSTAGPQNKAYMNLNEPNVVNSKSSAQMANETAPKEAHNSPRTHDGWFANTFHWELNFYSFTFLAFVYLFLKEEYRWCAKVMAGLIAVDAARYYHMKGSMAGVPYTSPFVTVIAMLVQPERFWAEMANIAMASPDGFMMFLWTVCNGII
jgi:hypothetical protein